MKVVLIGNGSGDDEVFNVRNLKYDAGVAVAYGLAWDDALRVDHAHAGRGARRGESRWARSRPGRDANIVVWSGDPFEFTTRVEHVLIRGREVAQPSRQDELMQRYKTLSAGVSEAVAQQPISHQPRAAQDVSLGESGHARSDG